MQIKKIDLIRYGHFENKELEFAENGLTIIYGPNEAGKSTTLAAISELLYGFDHRCAYDFKFDKQNLRIGGTLVNKTGAELTFRRRKGNKSTVIDVDESGLPDSVLSPFLGQSDKSFFEKSFGLSHARLREGGEAIGKADGDLGKILFEAGSGITDLQGIQDRFQYEAEEIFTPRRAASKLLYQSLDQYEAAQSALKAATLKEQDWQNAQQALAEAREKLDHARSTLRELSARQAKINRSLRVLPIYRELLSHRSALVSTGALIPLPKDARQKYELAVAGRYHAETSIRDIQKRLAELAEEIDSCLVDQGSLDAAEEIQRLYESVAGVEQQLEKLPLLKASIDDLTQQMLSQAQRLNLPVATELPLLPKQPDITNISDMVAQRQQLDARLNKLVADEASTASQVSQLEQEIGMLGITKDPGTESAILQKLQRELAGVPDLSKLEREILKLDYKVAALLKNLPWEIDDAAELLQLKVPIKALVDEHRKSIDRAEREVEMQSDKVEEIHAQMEAARRKLDQFRKRQTFFSEEELQQVRTKRQDAWLLVRRVLQEDTQPTADEILRFELGDKLAAVYEKLTQQADDVADSRMESVEQIVKYQTLMDDTGAKEQHLQMAQAKLGNAQAALGKSMTAWLELWRGIGIDPESPAVMLEALHIVDSISEAFSARQALINDLKAADESKTKIYTQILELALQVGIAKTEGGDADFLIVRVENALAQQAGAFSRAESLTARISDHKQLHDKQKRDLVQLRSDIAEWQKQWSGCCNKVKLSPELTITQVTEAVGAWNDLAQKQSELERRRAELRDAEIRIQQFTSAASALAEKLRPDIIISSPSEAISVVRQFSSENIHMRQVLARLDELKKQQLEATAALERLEKAVTTAKADLGALVEMAGIDNEANLAVAIETAEQQSRIQAEVDAALKRLQEASEGEDEESIAASSTEISLDDLRAELNEVAGDIESVNKELLSLKAKETEAKSAVDELESKSGAADHAQAMQNAVAKMGVQVRDYLRLQAASTFLRHGIDRVRDKHKNPILARASELFANLTTGSFAGITTDYDARDNPTIVGVRPTAERVDVAGMSEGTRDQLYLALRLAYVEHYCATEEPLPFIGDDLFVNFDDDRTAAGLQVLSQIANCQIILFTHHDFVLDLAKLHCVSTTTILSLEEVLA